MSHRASLLIDGSSLFLTDAGMETVLIFHHAIDLPCFAAFPLVEHDAGRAALRRYYEPFLDLARERRTGFVLSAPTSRANADWGVKLGYDRETLAAVNRRSVRFVDELRASTAAWDRPVLVEGGIGPRGDAYAPSSMMSSEEAERYHSTQLRTLAGTAVDLTTAMTMTYADEAIGIVRAARKVDLPIAVSFTVDTDGRLPSGQTLRGAIEQVDAETDGGAVHFMIICAHPTHFTAALADEGSWLERIQGLRANASTRSHAELDEATQLDDGDPGDLAERYAVLRDALPNLRILGGCCGTDIRHVTAICDAWMRG